jgi:hypothetical protein
MPESIVKYSKVYQVVNRRTKLEQTEYQQRNLDSKSRELIRAIMIYLDTEKVKKWKHKNINYYNAHAINNNLIDLSWGSEITRELFTSIKTEKKRKDVLKAAIKVLVEEDYICEEEYNSGNGMYLINPLFYYDGVGFINVYLWWCYKTNTPIKNRYVEDSLKDEEGYFTPDMEELNHLVKNGRKYDQKHY